MEVMEPPKNEGQRRFFVLLQPMLSTQVLVPRQNCQLIPLSFMPEIKILRFLENQNVEREEIKPILQIEPETEFTKPDESSVAENKKRRGKKLRFDEPKPKQAKMVAEGFEESEKVHHTASANNVFDGPLPSPANLYLYKRTLIDPEKNLVRITYEENTLCNNDPKRVVVQCPFIGCQIRLYYAGAMKRHFSRHFLNDDVQVEYSCPNQSCQDSHPRGRCFNKLWQLRQHYFGAHAEKKYKCSYCKKGFSIPKYLNSHQKLCKTKLPCSCGLRFKYMVDLKRHTEKFQTGHSFDVDECTQILYA